MIKALIFDFDGTILDTESAWFYAYRDLYSEHKLELTLEVWGQCVGTGFGVFNPHIDIEEKTNQKLDHEQLQVYTKAKHDEYMAKELLRPGIEDYFKAAKKAGLKLAIASSSHREWIDKYLTTFNIAHYFDHIASADMVEHVKPSPELYLKALEMLGIEPGEAIAFEDSKNGLAAARSADIRTVLIPNGVTSFMKFENYNLLLSSLSDLSLDKLLEQMSDC